MDIGNYCKIVEIEEGRFAPSLHKSFVFKKNSNINTIENYGISDNPNNLYSEEECLDIHKEYSRLYIEDICPKLGLPIVKLDFSNIETAYLKIK